VSLIELLNDYNKAVFTWIKKSGLDNPPSDEYITYMKTVLFMVLQDAESTPVPRNHAKHMAILRGVVSDIRDQMWRSEYLVLDSVETEQEISSEGNIFMRRSLAELLNDTTGVYRDDRSFTGSATDH
jgi:hypothetical protein